MHDVDCWHVPIDASPPGAHERFSRLLSADERAFAARFRFSRDRVRYVLSHAALRMVISRYVGYAAENIVFARTITGKPKLVHPRSPLFFNLSHSSALTVIGVCRSAEIGVDIETIRDVPGFLEIARDHFSRADFAGINSLPQSDRLRGFLVTWVRKEAFVKGIGAGLSFPLSEFATGAPNERPFVTDANGHTMTNWTVLDFDLGQAVGAVAVNVFVEKLRVSQLDGSCLWDSAPA